MKDWKNLATALPALALAVALAGAPAFAQGNDDQDTTGQQAEPQASDSGTSDPGSEANEDMSAGPAAAADDSASGQHSLPFEEMTDEALSAQLSAQGYANARDFVRADSSISVVTDRDGEMTDVVVVPWAALVLPSTAEPASEQVGGTADADGGDGGAPADAEGGAAVGIGDASGAAGGDGGSVSAVARQDLDAIRTHIEGMGYANPRDYQWGANSVWATADKDGQPVRLYFVPGATAAQ